MPSGPIWRGSISVGGESVSVELFPATESHDERFQLVDRTDLSPIEGRHVAPEDVVRAFEVEKGRYVPMEPGDLDRVDVELADAIAVTGFVDPSEIDPILFRRSYHVIPSDRLEARLGSLYALVTIAIRGVEHPACLRPYRNGLLLVTMHRVDDVLEPPRARKAS